MPEAPNTPLALRVSFLKRYKAWVIASALLVVLLPAAAVLVSALVINPYQKYVVSPDKAKHTKVGIVLGAGINRDGKPYKELEARLDVAAKALEKGTVDVLILSGDNRFQGYNEPEAMAQYLMEKKHISRDTLQPDYAGRSTYESCERAAKVFGLKETIIFSAGSHLPRALFLCRHFGVEAYGVSSNLEANNSTRRELLARVKAMYNVYIHGENTVLGAPISVEY